MDSGSVCRLARGGNRYPRHAARRRRSRNLPTNQFSKGSPRSPKSGGRQSVNKPAKLPTVEQALEEMDERRKRNIAQRINAAMAEVDYIQKEKKSGMNYSIVSHDAVTAKVRPILQAHGVVYYPKDFHAQ